MIILAILTPIIACICALTINNQKTRNIVVGIISVITFGLVIGVVTGNNQDINVIEFTPGLSISFVTEPLGKMFALLASGLWVVTHAYAVGYMDEDEKNQKKHKRFFACFSFAIFATIGLALSKNLITMFLFYELLTVSTYPLVAHKQTEDAKNAARIYLGILMATSILFFLPAISWTYAITGTTEFATNGILNGKISGAAAMILLALFAFGAGKAALFPFHAWLPAAMVAPTPVSALLHAVAVVKAGVFVIMKVGSQIFGIQLLAQSADWLTWLAMFTIITASIIALTKDNLKARLAWSTISQLAYITLGTAIATKTGIIGAGLHTVTHAFGKITLFMCAGAIYIATHKTEISDMKGLGRKMPFTFAAFTIGALSIIGFPPFAGSWSKWTLMIAASDTKQLLVIATLVISSLLNVAYLVPIFANGFLSEQKQKNKKTWTENIKEAPMLCVVPPCLTAIGCIILFFFASKITTALAQ